MIRLNLLTGQFLQTSEEYDNGEMRAYVLKARDAKQKYIVPMNIDYRTLIMEVANGNTQEEEE